MFTASIKLLAFTYKRQTAASILFLVHLKQREFVYLFSNLLPFMLSNNFAFLTQVSLFVHAYVMSNSISTLYELNHSLADLGSKPDFEDLKLGPLLHQPVVYDMFKAPPGLPALPHITTIQILKHLEKYMTKEDLWRKKVDLKSFMEYLCEEYRCETPYELGVRIQSIGLAISVLLLLLLLLICFFSYFSILWTLAYPFYNKRPTLTKGHFG